MEAQHHQPLAKKGEDMVKITPIKAEIRDCVIKNCALYPYRMGHRPKGEEIIAESN